MMAVRCVTVLFLLSHVALVHALSGSSILDLQTRRGVPQSPSSAAIASSINSHHPLRLRGGKDVTSSLAEFQLNEDSQAKKVDICGSWDGWKERLPLKKQGTGWKQAHILPIGVHQYKFIIDDDVWKCSENLPQAPGPEGFMNNVMEVSDSSVKRGWVAGTEALLVTKEELKSALKKEVRTKRLANIQARMERLQNRVNAPSSGAAMVHSFTSEEDGESSRGSSMARQESPPRTPSQAAARARDPPESVEEDVAHKKGPVHQISKMGRGPSADDHKWEPVKGQKLGSKKGRGFKKLLKTVVVAAALAGAGFVAKEQFDLAQAKEAAAAKGKGKGKGWR